MTRDVQCVVEELPDGRRVTRRLEGGVLVSESRRERLPTGKTLHRDFDGKGVLTRELQEYGLFQLAIESKYRNGELVEQIYFSRRRLISRSAYEKARAKYPDMPPASGEVRDWGGELVKAARAEQTRKARDRRHRAPDHKKARAADAFCRKLLRSGATADALEWIKVAKHTLGEMGHRGSRQLVEKLVSHGAVRVVVCKIDSYDADGETSDHLVIELPKEATARAALFKDQARRAARGGFDGETDDGRTYLYLGLS